jgi:hypothetical protein
MCRYIERDSTAGDNPTRKHIEDIWFGKQKEKFQILNDDICLYRLLVIVILMVTCCPQSWIYSVPSIKQMKMKVCLQCSVDDVLNLVHDVVLGEEMALVSTAVDKH